MGMLSVSLKPNFLGLLKFLNSFNWFIVFFSLINLSVCIYEDQIGKFDWRQSYVGRIKFAQFDTVSTAKKIIVATEENVLAALNLKTGQVVWRHVFESASTGNIQLLHVTEKVVTVSGANPYLVRGWDTTTGVLLWEWSLTLQNDDQADFSEWWVQNNMLVHMLPVFGSHIEMSMYNLMTGQNRGSTSKLPAVWTNEGCVLSAPYYSCISGSSGSQLLISLDVTSNAVQLISKPLSKYITNEYDSSLRPLDGNSIEPGFIIGDKKIVVISNNDFEVLKVGLMDPSASASLVDSSSGTIVVQIWNDDAKGFSLVAHSVSTGKEVSEIRCSDKSLNIPEPEISAVMCAATAREMQACRILVTAADDASHLLQQGGRVIWSREEALAGVVAAEFVELPVSARDAAIEAEFDHHEGSVWAAFWRRLQTQVQQLQAALQQLPAPTDASPEPLERDYFNLHKVIVLVTGAGKIFGMDNLSGEILWSRYEAGLDSSRAVIYTRRSARHPPHSALVSIIATHEETGNGVIISLDPLDGSLAGERRLQLDVQLLQCALLHKADGERLHALVLLDRDENVQVFPVTSAPLVENLFLYVAERDTARMRGYALRYDGKEVVAEQTWSLNLGGSPWAGHRIVALAAKPLAERAHSPGRVLPDRSVLYKHSNPNLLLVLTAAEPAHRESMLVATCIDAASGVVVAAQTLRRARPMPLAVLSDNFMAYLYYNEKHRRPEIAAHARPAESMLVATCIDAASGVVVAAQTLRRARPMPLAVLSDNFMAYLYYNEKHRRPEIATMELYEGPERWVEAGAAFSSFGGARSARVHRAAYVLPAAAAAAAVTVTERALAARHLLLALSTGAIVELPWAYLEPRRTIAAEEGLLPYAPELPLPAEAVLNYNRTLHRVGAVYTAPSGLESTSLVLATGLDLFYTRVAPSKTFDLLKEDFDYYLIVIVLTALVVATYSTKYFASRKMLKMAWK